MGNEKAKNMLISLLADEEIIKKIEFEFGNFQVKPSLYRNVLTAIRGGAIRVFYIPKIAKELVKSGRGAIYIQSRNELYVKSDKIPGDAMNRATYTALLIHECTHIGFDLLKSLKMTHAVSEAIAYTAGYMYVISQLDTRYGVNARILNLRSRDKSSNGIMQVSQQVAKNLYYKENKLLTIMAWFQLIIAIEAHPVYKDIALESVLNDG